jgi:teichuronic acid biosynthesis glycosyltransferase TuaG
MSPEVDEPADVSVIIPAYRARETIGRALASVAGQTRKPREVVVVDDGSDDGTLEAAEAMAEQMNGIALSVESQDNQGAGSARNKALNKATSTYIAFLDADDEWMAEKIERSMTLLTETSHVLVGHDFIRVETNGTEQVIECARRFHQARDPFVGLFRQGFIGTSTVVVRRDAVQAVGGFDESLETAQDFDLWLKMLAVKGTTFTIFPEALTRYYVTGGSITSFIARRLACSLMIARRHAPGLPNLWLRILAIHYEAITAYCLRGQSFQVLCKTFVLPWNLLTATLTFRSDVAVSPALPGWAVMLVWAWVIGAYGAYVYRFQDLLRAAVNMLKHLG